VSDETRVTLAFADGEKPFWLPMSRVVAFEREAECSIFALFHEIGQNLAAAREGTPVLIGASAARMKQVHSLIRNALIGAGEDEQEARELVQTYCYPVRPAIHDMALAWQVLSAAIYGIDTSGSKKKAEAESPSPS
jgi:hypothetical protein